MPKRQPLYPHIPASKKKPEAKPKELHFSMFFDVSYSQANRSSGRRYLSDKFASYKCEITDADPKARIESGGIIGSYYVYTVKDIRELFKGRRGGPKIELLDW